MIHWDRANQPIRDTIEWAKLYEDPGYRFLALDVEPNGDHEHWVSTIWLGLSSGAILRPTTDTALIFETGYFVDGNIMETFPVHSEEEAFETHAWACQKYLHRAPRPEDGHLQTAIDNTRVISAATNAAHEAAREDPGRT